MLGYALAKWAWGKGYMTEAAREVVRYGFEELRIPLLTCTHYLFNDRSRRVIEKCGFVREGTLHAAEASPDGTIAVRVQINGESTFVNVAPKRTPALPWGEPEFVDVRKAIKAENRPTFDE